MEKVKITVVITGGTIDSVWDGSKDTVVPAKESGLPEYFEKIKLETLELEFNTVCMKDSRELTPGDVKNICKMVDECPSAKVLVTHGTYTMPDTARYLAQNMKTKKSVVLTGSMIPLKGYEASDAPFNLGFALATLQTMKPGVLLAMHGRTFEPGEVAKNLSEARFFSIKQ